MATSLEMSRINRIANTLKKVGPQDEFYIKTTFKLGVSVYNQLKREVRLSPLYNHMIRITSKRGESDMWEFIATEEES